VPVVYAAIHQRWARQQASKTASQDAPVVAQEN